MSTPNIPMCFLLCEVDPHGEYEVKHYGVDWVVKRSGVRIGTLPRSLVEEDGAMRVAEMLIGYGCFVSKKTYEVGVAGWVADWFPSLVDAEVKKHDSAV